MRRLTLISVAAATLLAAPAFTTSAFAYDLKTGGVPVGAHMPMGMAMPGHPMMGSPLMGGANTNVGVATNTAAGIGNKAQQQVIGIQQGSGFGNPLVNTNVGVATNVAAGIGNKAQQSVTGVTFGFGRGGLMDTNVGVNTNVAAGLGNFAGQSVFGLQAR
ncbi:hypothetical protein [Azospirillum soli]|uniref:hypothetical protein n=1 Tax=Azospirillum soli TaxID=1304799 RepID=UPI001AEA9760|nr:hypothetical protein [Azospirillum soli]MBP2312532.1 hypothetical protein [Azospirillum soli]